MAEPTDQDQPNQADDDEPLNSSLHDVLDLLGSQVAKLKESLEFFRLTDTPDKDNIVRWHVEQIDQRQDRMDEIKQMILSSGDEGQH